MDFNILMLAFFLDLVLGDPVYRFHPVRLMGKLAETVERQFFKYKQTGIFSGILFWLILVSFSISIYLFISMEIIQIDQPVLNLAWQGFVVYSCFAFRDMIRHLSPIYDALATGNLNEARKKLSYIVGRDVENLSRTEIIKAAIESLSESFVDGFFSPIFWYVAGSFAGIWIGSNGFLLGGISIIVFRFTSTLDSMVGYQNERYEKFGKFSAKMDDVLNFISARLSIIFISTGAFLSGANMVQAIQSFLKDRLNSESPNAAHSMSAFAGALNIMLGGDASYSGYLLKKPALGTGQGEITVEHISTAIKIFFFSGVSVIAAAGFMLYVLQNIIRR